MTARWPWWAQATLAALAYYAAARLGLLLAFEGSNASPVWPPSGIAMALLVIGGLRLLPAVLVGAFAANAVVFAANGLPPGVNAAASLAIASGNALEAAWGAWMLRRWVQEPAAFNRLADVGRFAAIVAGAAVASAGVGSLTLVAAGVIPGAAWPTVALTWWTGDVTGMLVLVPLLLGLTRLSVRAADAAEAAVLAAVVGALGWLVFVEPATATGADRRLVWLFMPCVAWAALRRGPVGVGACSLLVAGLAIWGTTRGTGPFASGGLNDALIALQAFVGLTALTGLMLAADRQERLRLGLPATRLGDLAVPWAVLLGSLGITVLGWHLVATGIERRAAERIDFITDDIEKRIRHQIAAHEMTLRGAAALFAASEQVTRSEWKAYVEQLNLKQTMPGIQTLSFARWLGDEPVAAHEAQVRAEGPADYRSWTADGQPARSAIVYIEPLDASNRRVLGFDMLSEPVRRAALELARDTGLPVLSGPVTLLQAAGPDATGVLLCLPVYGHGMPLFTTAQRRQALRGFVTSPVQMDRLVQEALGSAARQEGVAVRFYDGTSDDPGDTLFTNADGPVPRTGLSRTRNIALSQQAWLLLVDALPAFERQMDVQKGQLVLVAGSGLSLLLFALLCALTLTRERALVLADEMTAAIRDSQEQFRSLAESAAEAIVVADAQGRIVSANAAAERMFGHAPDELPGRSLTGLMPERFRQAHTEGIERVRQGGARRMIGGSVQLVGLASDGREFPIELSLATWQTTGGDRYYSGIIRDITAREHAAQALRDSEQAAREAERQLQAVLNASPMGIVFTDAEGAVRYANPAFARIAGTGPHEAAGWLQHVHPADQAGVGHAWRGALGGGIALAAEFRFVHAGGEVVWARVQSAPIVEDGRTVGHVALAEDVSRRVLADRNLADKATALERSNAELAQFAYVASHDLKEPLRTVASYSQLLLRRHRGQLDAEGAEFLDFIGEGARRAQALVADLLSLARLEGEQRPATPVALQSVYDEACRGLGAALRDSGGRITASALPEVQGDRGQLLQLMQNLLANALQFARPGVPPLVHVSAERLTGCWRIAVADNGVGIEPRFQQQIFAIFQRLQRGAGGTGIGLAICKKVVERHGGQMSVESTPGRGSTFFFTIPTT